MAVWFLRISDYSSLTAPWFDSITKVLSTRGPVETIRYVKTCRLAYTRYLCGQPFSKGAGLGISLTSDGIPVSLGPLITLAREGGTRNVRAILTAMLVSRIIPGNVSPDLTSIITPGPPRDNNLLLEITAVMKMTGWTIGRPIWERPHLSTKAGPNGQAMLCAMKDATLLTPQMVTDITTLGGQKVASMIENNIKLSHLLGGSILLSSPFNRLRKLSVIPDKEAKARVIAIFDYWSQTVLFPLHNAVFGLLKRIKADCTFDQTSFAAKLTSPAGAYSSFDLSSATDRFPIWFQEEVLAHLVGSEEYASAWVRTLTSHEFWVPWTGSRVLYACGQPMGAYSSWAVFALSHHVCVLIAARRANASAKGAYALLGDDIVIANDAIAMEYQALMKELGVSISEQKSHVSPDTYEFAKRWIHQGQEVTGAPISILFQGPKLKYFVAADFIRNLRNRWTESSGLVTRRWLAELYEIWGVPKGYTFRLAQKSYDFLHLPIREDTYREKLVKADYFHRNFFDNITGCNRYKFTLVLLWEWLAEAKTNVLEEAIKSQTRLLNQFLASLGEMKRLSLERLDTQSILTSPLGLTVHKDRLDHLLQELVPVRVVLENLGDMQAQFDRLRADFTSGRERAIVCDSTHYAGCVDPSKVFSKRTSQLVLYSQASLLNKFKKLASIYTKGRLDYIASDEE